MKNQVNTILEFFKHLDDIFYLAGLLALGTFSKIFFAKEKGKKITAAYVSSETIVSIFMAVSFYYINEQFIHFTKMFAFVVCAWSGSMSTIIHAKVEELLILFFDTLKTKLTNKTNETN